MFFKNVKTFWEEDIWGTASGTLEIVLHCFLSVQFYSCPHFWQIYFKCFLHTALLQSLELILTLVSFYFFILFLFLHFFNANVTLISVTNILHSNVCCFSDSATFKTLHIFVITVCCNPTLLAERRVICVFTRSIPNCQMKAKVRMSCLISLKTMCAFVRAVSRM